VTLLAPAFLLAAAGAGVGVTLLHFLARRRPPDAPLPTARFVPDLPVRAPSRARRPSDLALLALRVTAVLLAGLAMARPVATPRKRALARVVMLERSRAVANPAAAADSARAWLAPGDALVAFDTVARAEPAESLASLAAAPWLGRASLSSALLLGQRLAASLRSQADSIELVLVSPLDDEAWDAATGAIRAQWPAAVRLVRVPLAAAAHGGIDLMDTTGDDPVAAAIALLGPGARQATVRVRRASGFALPASDSAFAQAGGALVRWPAQLATVADTVGAVAASGLSSSDEAVIVAPFARDREFGVGAAGVVARWADGVPAATERPLGKGCVRDVAVMLPVASDLPLRSAARQFVRRMVAPCGGYYDALPLADSLTGVLRAGASRLGAGALPVPLRAGFPPITRWLLIGVAVLLGVEMFLRSRGA